MLLFLAICFHLSFFHFLLLFNTQVRPTQLHNSRRMQSNQTPTPKNHKSLDSPAHASAQPRCQWSPTSVHSGVEEECVRYFNIGSGELQVPYACHFPCLSNSHSICTGVPLRRRNPRCSRGHAESYAEGGASSQGPSLVTSLHACIEGRENCKVYEEKQWVSACMSCCNKPTWHQPPRTLPDISTEWQSL